MRPTLIKAIFFDIDGTLLSFKTHTVSKSTERSIEKLKSLGIKVIVSTGRSINSIDHIKYLDFDGFITFNGGYCVDRQGQILYKKTLDSRDIVGVMNYSSENEGFSFSFMSEQQITLHNPTSFISDMYLSLNLPVPKPVDFDLVDSSSILQVNVFIKPELQDTFMKGVMPNSVASRWTPIFADVNPMNQSKKTGIQSFLNRLNISRKETMAFGDGGNDIEMLKFVEIGVAMGNANPEVKEIADYITTDVDTDGIEKALLHFGVI